MTCLTENTVVELVEGLLEAEAREQAHAHLHRCGACRQLVSAVVRLADPGDGGRRPPDARGSSPETASDGWLPRGTSIDRYVILEPVGAGSAGTVYAAYDADLDRRVALKLLRTVDSGDPTAGPDGEGARATLLREARAMARLSHPHVIAVHDVGATERGVFVAMEFVSGHTLREWREARPRSWDEIRDVFVAAGRGLSAAHRAGLVHRDFKPDNVLVGRDGGVRVTDFGLARLLGPAPEPASAAPPLHDPPMVGDQEGLWRLTRTGALVGTPAYMAPEQHQGGAADARSDQFSFCVALHEAVHGQRPFTGRSIDELREAAVRGAPRSDPSARVGVPAAVARALERGLSPDPSARFPSMDALLDELTGQRRERRRRRIALVGLVALLALAGGATAAAWLSRETPATQAACTGAERHLAAMWSRDRAGDLGNAFSATRVVYADGTWRRVRPIVDEYARGWIAAHEEACRATRVLGEQSEAALDLRMQCLAARRRELGALLDSFAAADGTVVERAVQASLALRPTAACADLEALTEPTARPSDPAVAARLEVLEAELARTRAMNETGRWREAVAAARELAPRASALGHAPFLAEVLLILAELQVATGEPDAAAHTLDEVILAADAGRDDARRAEALIRAASISASPTSEAASAKLAAQAGAIVGRLRDRHLNAELARARGRIAYVTARLEEARRHYERALAEDEAAFPPDDPRLSASLDLLGDLLERMGDYEAARRHFDRARRIAEKALGPDHPVTANAYANLASLATSGGKLDESLRLLDRVLAIRERVLGEGNRATALALYKRGEVLFMMKHLDRSSADLEKALRLTRALATRDEGLEALCLVAMGKVAFLRADYRDAVALVRGGLAIHRRLGDKRNVAPDLYALGETLLRQGKLDQALAPLDEAQKIWESFLGPDHPHVAYALDSIGQVRIRQRRFAQAIAPLERAYRIRGGATTPWGADSAAALAEALWGARRDDRRAIALIREAADFWRAHPDRYVENLASADAWLAAHRPRR